MIPSRLISNTVVPRTSSGLLMAPRICWRVRRNVKLVYLLVSAVLVSFSFSIASVRRLKSIYLRLCLSSVLIVHRCQQLLNNVVLLVIKDK